MGKSQANTCKVRPLPLKENTEEMKVIQLVLRDVKLDQNSKFQMMNSSF